MTLCGKQNNLCIFEAIDAHILLEVRSYAVHEFSSKLAGTFKHYPTLCKILMKKIDIYAKR